MSLIMIYMFFLFYILFVVLQLPVFYMVATLDSPHFDLFLSAFGSGSDKCIAAYASARNIETQSSSLSMVLHISNPWAFYLCWLFLTKLINTFYYYHYIIVLHLLFLSQY